VESQKVIKLFSSATLFPHNTYIQLLLAEFGVIFKSVIFIFEVLTSNDITSALLFLSRDVIVTLLE